MSIRRSCALAAACVTMTVAVGPRVAAAPAAPETALTYKNPVYAHNFPDPFVLRYKGVFYAYATEDRQVAQGRLGFQVMESRDLVHWTHRGVVLRAPWSRQHYWAPEVIERGGIFYMTYSALNPRTDKHDIGIATAKSPLGPFEHKAILVRAGDNRVGVIDATIFTERDGANYLVYSEEEPRRIVMRKMAPDLMSVTGDAVELVRPDRPDERGVTEAPTLFWSHGMYHLIYSSGPYQGNRENCRYAVRHATSRALTGPYRKDDRALLQSVPDQVYGPGHQCVIDLPNGDMWMLYHGWNAEGEPRYGANAEGRSLRLDPIHWNGDHLYMDAPSTTERAAPKVK